LGQIAVFSDTFGADGIMESPKVKERLSGKEKY
jgi:hypothetical protein